MCTACCMWSPFSSSSPTARVVMESTGIYWKSAYAHLDNAGITACWVVNAPFIKPNAVKDSPPSLPS